MTAGATLVEPAYRSAPSYDFTLGPVVGEFCASVGYGPDPEQQPILDDIFAEDERNLPVVFATTVVGPRRNIKTGVELQAGLGWINVLEVKQVDYSAHKWKTALKTFETASEIIKNSDDLSRQMLPSLRGTGYCKLRWKSGAEWNFSTRTLAGGRGEETDKHILDEALAIRRLHTASLLLAMATRPLAQVIYGSSACVATSEVLRELVERGRAGAQDASKIDPRLSYTEFCAPGPEVICDLGVECTHRRGTPGCGLDKPEWIAIANPQYGRRIPTSFFVDMRGELSPHDYGREIMGWHDAPILTKAEQQVSPFDLDRWVELVDEDASHAPAMPSAGIELDLDGAVGSITGGGTRDDGAKYIEVLARGRGTAWIVRDCIELKQAQGVVRFAIDGGGPAGRLKKDLEDAGLEVVVLGTSDVCDAAAELVDLVNDRDTERLRHGPQSELDAAVDTTRKRTVGRRFAFARATPDDDVTPIQAGSYALWALDNAIGEVSIFGAGSLDLCDRCNKNPHEDPDGEHGYLCPDCRDDEED